ncbi:MAG: acetate kinase [Jaaginema sp. PMC 1079.18]|nr:acetate kinase [Jaaginema sp. PMC 1080.18]MEC4851061.1 acetate kinase [Jaaginema sp. PMC 1079.18]MEC4866977.1 acetate kinase [Jaaginema sp. PMC 1078.18]
MKILVLNAGSSSQKSALYQLENPLPNQPIVPLWEGQIDWQKNDTAQMSITCQSGAKLEQELSSQNRETAIAKLLDTLYQGETQVIQSLAEIDGVGHRVVHGGAKYREAVQITSEVETAIASLIPLAPEHNPINLQGIQALRQKLPDIPQFAVFDTAFHSTIPQKAAVYPIPYRFFEQGIRRYGFHGISHQYSSQRIVQILGKSPQNLITCHLGNGASLAAVQKGVCIDTTMGYTPLEGVMMGSRSGSIDPGILVHLLRQGEQVEDLNHLLNQESGLKGVSGISHDLRLILAAIQEGNLQAQLAFDVYVHRLRRQVGAMFGVLGGLDALVFTGGLGEHSPEIRQQTCQAFANLGLELDEAKNQENPVDAEISTPDSTIGVVVIRARENFAIATECWRLLSAI